MEGFRNILIVVLCLLASICFGQTQTPEEVYLEGPLQERNFSETKWKSVIEGIDYSGKPPAKKQKAEQKQNGQMGGGRRYPSRSNSWGGGGAGAMMMRFLLILLLGILLAVLIRHLLGLQGINWQRKRKEKAGAAQIDIAHIEENIHETDLDRYIRQALGKEDYGLAIRLYYLAILKELSLKKAIKWKKDKTNRDYHRELRATNLADSFSEVTLIFERAWYGQGQLREKDFKRIEPKFQHFMYSIK